MHFFKNVSNLFSFFLDEDVTVRSLLKMSEYALEKIFPKAGPRSNFMAQVEDYKKELAQVNMSTSMPIIILPGK